MKQATVIYHNKDLDGFCSGAIARHALESEGYEVEMIGWNYGDEPYFPDYKKEKVVMTDITYPMYQTRKMNEFFGSDLTVIDHHRSFIEQARNYSWDAEMILDESYAACEMTWMHFMKGVTIPFFVNAVAVWDIHRKKDCGFGLAFEDYAQLQLGLKLEYKDPVDSDNFMNWIHGFKKSLHDCFQFMHAGKIIQESFINHAEKLNERAHTCMLSNGSGMTKFNCINSGVNKHVEVDGRWPLCFYWFDGSKWVYSLRQNETQGLQEQDILSVAKFHGGGGHPNACGFSTTELIFGK